MKKGITKRPPRKRRSFCYTLFHLLLGLQIPLNSLLTFYLQTAFLPYLLPEAAEAIETGRDDIIALGAVTNANQTCGAVVGELYDERLTIFSLYVDPEVRRQGVGALLLDSLLQLYPEAKPMAAWVLPEESFTEMDAFFQARGFAAAQNEGFVYCLNTEDLRHVPVVRWAFSPTFRPDRNIVPLDELTQEEREDLLCDASKHSAFAAFR